MSESPQDIISDTEIVRVHANANFGSMTPREVVNDGVRKYAVGYTGGATQLAILLEHGLIKKPKDISYRSDLTEKGKRYARSIYTTPVDDGRPCSTDAWMAAALDQLKDKWDFFEACKDWCEGDWQGAMEGITISAHQLKDKQ